jgi:hypothetical protein
MGMNLSVVRPAAVPAKRRNLRGVLGAEPLITIRQINNKINNVELIEIALPVKSMSQPVKALRDNVVTWYTGG